MAKPEKFDVIVIGGGPAGSVMAWSLAKNGVNVAVLERSQFPREKVCGDFVEPGGLRILEAMGCLEQVEDTNPLPITHAAAFVNAELVFRGEIPYYPSEHRLRPYGYIVPRIELDSILLERAEHQGARVIQSCQARAITREGLELQVHAKKNKKPLVFSAPLVVGADGTESIVARTFGLDRHDPRHSAIAQRGYVEGASLSHGEATIWFDADLYPGYGWMFPLADGRANIGVGILSEACKRHDLSVPALYSQFIEKLRQQHPSAERIRPVGKTLGGIVKTYGGITSNVFDGGILVGDAGSFVDPMTGEGITQGMESALIGSRAILAALETGDFSQAKLGSFENDYRRYFGPTMAYLDLYAAVTRNWHLREFSLRAGKRGWQEAASDGSFAEVAGSTFGGLNLNTAATLTQMTSKVMTHITQGGIGMILDIVQGRSGRDQGLRGDIDAWARGLRDSLIADPKWHFNWMMDVTKKMSQLSWTAHNPRHRGAPELEHLLAEQ